MTTNADPNMLIWNSVCKTDPAFTKKFNRRGFKGDAINPCYVSRRLTEIFGPCGWGWKFVLEHEEYRPGHTLANGDVAVCHVVRGHLEYQLPDRDGWLATGPQFGQTMFVYEDSGGVKTDEEAPKKSISDCLGKCAVLLGIGADIHLGLWDSSKYINDQTESRESRAESRKFSTPHSPLPTPHLSAPAGEPASSSTPSEGSKGLPANFEHWFAEQWAEFFTQQAATIADAAVIFGYARKLKPLYEHEQHWREFCESFGKHFRSIDDKKKSPARTELMATMKEEKKRLDALASQPAANGQTD